jgi:hypothetical protein
MMIKGRYFVITFLILYKSEYVENTLEYAIIV